MNNQRIETEQQFERVAERIEALKDALPNSIDAWELKHLTRLVKDYALEEMEVEQKQPKTEHLQF